MNFSKQFLMTAFLEQFEQAEECNDVYLCFAERSRIEGGHDFLFSCDDKYFLNLFSSCIFYDIKGVDAYINLIDSYDEHDDYFTELYDYYLGYGDKRSDVFKTMFAIINGNVFELTFDFIISGRFGEQASLLIHIIDIKEIDTYNFMHKYVCGHVPCDCCILEPNTDDSMLWEYIAVLEHAGDDKLNNVHVHFVIEKADFPIFNDGKLMSNQDLVITSASNVSPSFFEHSDGSVGVSIGMSKHSRTIPEDNITDVMRRVIDTPSCEGEVARWAIMHETHSSSILALKINDIGLMKDKCIITASEIILLKGEHSLEQLAMEKVFKELNEDIVD